MSDSLRRRNREAIARWRRDNEARRREAFVASMRQRRPVLAALEREGLRAAELPSIVDEFDVAMPTL